MIKCGVSRGYRTSVWSQIHFWASQESVSIKISLVLLLNTIGQKEDRKYWKIFTTWSSFVCFHPSRRNNFSKILLFIALLGLYYFTLIWIRSFLCLALFWTWSGEVWLNYIGCLQINLPFNYFLQTVSPTHTGVYTLSPHPKSSNYSCDNGSKSDSAPGQRGMLTQLPPSARPQLTDGEDSQLSIPTHVLLLFIIDMLRESHSLEMCIACHHCTAFQDKLCWLSMCTACDGFRSLLLLNWLKWERPVYDYETWLY